MRQLLPEPGGSPDLAAVYAPGRRAGGGRPWVRANMVAGIDGTAAFEGRVGGLSSPADQRLFALLRSMADIVLVGAGTVRAEGYGPVRVPPYPPVAVVTRSLDLDWASPLFGAGARTIVIAPATAEAGHLRVAREHADVILSGDGSVDLSAALATLAARGASTVLTEGGPALLGELLGAGLLDELCLTIAPVAGGDALPIVATPPGARRLVGFQLASALEEDAHLFLRYLTGRGVSGSGGSGAT